MLRAFRVLKPQTKTLVAEAAAAATTTTPTRYARNISVNAHVIVSSLISLFINYNKLQIAAAAPPLKCKQANSIARTSARHSNVGGDNSITHQQQQLQLQQIASARTANKLWRHRVLAMHATASAAIAANANATAAVVALQLANNNNNTTTNCAYTSARMPTAMSVPVPVPLSLSLPMTNAAAAADANRLPPLPPTMLMTTGNGLFYVERGATNTATATATATADAYYDRRMASSDDGGRIDAHDHAEAEDNGRRRHAAAGALGEHNGDETDSCGSMETVSDNVAVWLEEDGARHWVSGVDANTTCADLIDVLLNYQHEQQMFGDSSRTNNNCAAVANARHARHDASASANANANGSGDSNSNNNNNNNNISSKAINQSTTNHTKEDCKTKAAAATTTAATAPAAATKPVERAPLLRRPGGMTAAALACEYVIVKQHRHCEEYLDGSAKVFDVLPAHGAPARKECELLLRRLAAPSSIATVTAAAAAAHLNTQVSSLLSTDKDSGMGSPVGSSRSARFRRRKHKSASSSWLAQANTLHPKVSQRGLVGSNVGGGGVGGGGAGGDVSAGGSNSGPNANERLLKIILAQDETIHRQLTLLREKERQISKIEEEKHRVRERELGKNYLLETYLNGLDEADVEPDPEQVDDAEVEIFIDEPYHRFPAATATAATTTTTMAATSQLSPPPAVARLKPRQGKQQKMNDDYASADAAARGLRSPRTVDAPVRHVDAASRKEIEQQLLWLEKIYALNKQLQREEELLLKLHAKIRKHQVKRAYQTKREVLHQIDKLDAELTLQCCDIRQVEHKLVASNEQLKHKLGILEALSQEFLATAPGMGHAAADVGVDKSIAATANAATEEVAIARGVGRADGERNTTTENAESGEHLRKHETLIAFHQRQPAQSTLQPAQQQPHSPELTTAQQWKLNKLQTVHDVLSLQQMIAKPSTETSTSASASTTETTTTTTASTTETTATTTATTTSALTASSVSTAVSTAAATPATTTTAKALQHQHQQQHQQQQQLGVLPHSNYPISCINHAAIHANSNISTAATTPAATPTLLQQKQQQVQQQQQQQLAQQNTNSSNISSSYSDKNLLLSLHAHSSAKTVKKQMFGPKLLHQIATTAPTTTTTVPTIKATVNAMAASPITLGHCHGNNNEAHSCAGGLLRPTSSSPAAARFLRPMSPLPVPLPPLDSNTNSIDISQLGTLV